MLYRFKSRAAGDLVMLEHTGRRLLEIIGKDPAQPGIIEVQDIERAIAQLDAASAAERSTENGPDKLVQESAEQEEISLARRAMPLVEMLHRSRQAGAPVVWGV